jgi:hypothetical protein
MTCSVTSVIDDTMTCSFRFVEVFLGTCGREIEREALTSSSAGRDHGRTLADAKRQPALLPHNVPFCSGFPPTRTKSWEACEHPCPDLSDEARLLMVLPILIVVILPHGGKSFIPRSVSSVDPFVICSLVLLITWANQTFKKLFVISELCFGVVDHILMQHGCSFSN